MAKRSTFQQAPAPRVAALLLSTAALAGVAVAFPSLEAASMIALVTILVLCLADGLLLFYSRPEVEITGPEKATTLHRMREGSIAFSISKTRQGKGHATTVSITLPKGFRERCSTLDISNETATQVFNADILPLKRGSFLVKTASYAGVSILKFWYFRQSQAIDWKLLVYPNLPAEDPNIAAFLLRRDLSGMTVRRMLGLGREFDRLRDYQPGDPYSSISWKASARRLSPITVVRQIERTQQIYSLIDVSQCSRSIVDYTSPPDNSIKSPMLAIDRYINGTLALALAAKSQGDCFGTIAFSRYPTLFMKARGGDDHFLAVQNQLRDLAPDEGQPNYEELFSQARSKIRSRSLLVVFTQFDNASLLDSFLDAVRIVSRQHLVLAVSIQPDYAHELFHGEEVESENDIVSRIAGHLNWKQLANAKRRLASAGIQFVLAPQENLCAQTVSSYLKIKERQLV